MGSPNALPLGEVPDPPDDWRPFAMDIGQE